MIIRLIFINVNEYLQPFKFLPCYVKAHISGRCTKGNKILTLLFCKIGKHCDCLKLTKANPMLQLFKSLSFNNLPVVLASSM